jgi:5-methylcytosine-specific restriction endonuclease McrA
MRIELWIFFITIAILYDTYHNHMYSKKIYYYKKYFKIIGIAIAVLLFFVFIKKNPDDTHNILQNLNNCIKYLPLDKTTSSILSSGTGLLSQNNNPTPIINTPTNIDKTTTVKRSVSETKKKYVAYSQGWKCNFCNKTLDHTYEIDHKVELRNGGSNETDNLVALCAGCHRLKTASNYL